MEFKEFKRVYVGPSNVNSVMGVGGPFETGEEVTVTASAAEKGHILSEQHFDESFPGLFERPGTKLAKEAVAAREKVLKQLKSGPEAVEKVVIKAEEKAEEKSAKGGKE